MKKSRAEEILDKYYPQERTVFREAILKAMDEYTKELTDEITAHRITNNLLLDNKSEEDLANRFYKKLQELHAEKRNFEDRYIVANAKLAVENDVAKQFIDLVLKESICFVTPEINNALLRYRELFKTK